MPLESRSRITLLFPAPESAAEFALLDSVFTELIRFCGGVTASLPPPRPVFNGWWIDGQGVPRPDANIVIFADTTRQQNDQELLDYLDRLKARCQRELQEDIIWITVAPVTRIATADFTR